MRFRADLGCLASAWLLACLTGTLHAWQNTGEAQPQRAARSGGSAAVTDRGSAPLEPPRELAPPAARRVPGPVGRDTSGVAVARDDAHDGAPPPANHGTAGGPTVGGNNARRRPAIEASKMNGIQPGASKLADVQKVWGQPVSAERFEGYVEHTYHLEPFQKIKVTLVNDTVTSLMVYLQDKFSADDVRQQLELGEIEPVLVTSDQGEILGQAFPERGVLFSFEPGQKEHLVAQILLRPIEYQPFALRAEANLRTNYDSALYDLQQAVRLSPRFARGYWLQAQVLAALGRIDQAVTAVNEALRLEPSNAEYRLTRSDLLAQQGQHGQAVAENKHVLAQPDLSPLVRGRGLLQLALLEAGGGERKYHAAVEHRQEAIKVVSPLAADDHPALRRAAVELLVDAHLGIAHDIAWGSWNRKSEVVPRWLEEAQSLSQEAAVVGVSDHSLAFRVGQKALSALAGLRGELDPAQWVDMVRRAGLAMMEDIEDPLTLQQHQWAFGLALYDALQVYHSRGQAEPALECGEAAIELIERAAEGESLAPLQAYLLGRLYFRHGAAHAVLMGDHNEALSWFEKALPLLQQGAASQPLELGKQGEAHISMAISYWEMGEQRKALQLTTRGVELLEKAVRAGQMTDAALLVAYGNMSAMHRHLGDERSAQRFAQLARKPARQPK
jgi:tetratricopeptide (TPR) repeat protein